jgi:transglutaminase-like putative cysteine protease
MAQAATQFAATERLGGHLASSAPDAADRYFELSLFGLLTTGFLTLATTGRMDTFTLVVMSLALSGKAYLLWYGSDFRLASTWVRGLTVCYLPFLIFDAVFLQAAAVNILERGLLALIHFVFFAEVVELFSASRTRDYVFLAALAFAQMLGASTLTVGTAFLLFFALFLLLAIATFTSFEIRRARDRVAGPRPAIAQAGKWTGLAPALSVTSAIICIGVVMLSTLLFFVIPRANRGYFSALSRPSDRMTGFSDDVELGQIGQIKRSSRVVMHIDAPELGPNDGVKWRGIALTSFDGRRWTNDSETVMAVPGRRSFRFSQQPVHPGAPPRLLNYSITLEPIASDAVFLAPQPLELIGPFRNLWQDNTGSVFMPSNSGALVRYSVVSDVALPTADALQSEESTIPPEVRSMYLQMPRTDSRTLELARQVTAPYGTTYEKARAVESYLQTNYGYTLDLPPAMPEDPIAYFMFELRAGHCEFFASSMAVMLRAVGVPARLVNGFLQGQYNEISGQYTVRASDAHTWVEVYFPQHGWVSFDPTPAEGRLAQDLWLGRMALYIDAFEAFWEEWVINYDFIHQVTLARQLERTSRRLRGDSRDYLRDRYRNLVAALRAKTDGLLQNRLLLATVIAVVSVGIVALYARFGIFSLLGEWNLRRRARQGKLRPQDATLLYTRLLRIFARRGVRKLPAQTPNEFAESVPEPARPLVRDFTRLYLETRFGRLTVAIPQMTALLTQIQDRLKAKSPA